MKEIRFRLRISPRKRHLKRSSSPKILPLCPSLYTIHFDAQLNQEERGRSFECAVGAALSRLPGELYYWRERNEEVDYVYKYGKKLIGIEVKSNDKKHAKGLSHFKRKYPEAKVLLINQENYEDLYGLISKQN